jgi:RNA polymerase sigma-70 factor, ECF subfamily
MPPKDSLLKSRPGIADPLPAPSTETLADDATPEQIALCLNGNQRAWEHLVEVSYDRVYFTCYRFIGAHPEAEDLTQDVFMKVFCNLHNYDAEKGSFRNWLKNVTRNHLVDRYRRTKLVRLSSSLDEQTSATHPSSTFADLLTDTRPSQEERLVTLETHARVHAALKQLSPTARDTAVLCFIDEQKRTDVAQILGIPEGTVKSRLNRARAELSQLLNPPQLVQA